ncbi:hypothetical protein ACFWDA_25755 [Rhodococcus zopfii]|uniref:hypothetical protein n=1 Tax=Rhodococcus zopfii TaxID=43772 RepID=UPI0036643D89
MSLDTSRAPAGELVARALVDAVIASDDRIERHYLEVKSTLDLDTKKDQAKLAKFILGAANRMPDKAAAAFEGHGVMVIGASNGSALGIPPIEALEIQKAVLPYIGADGPRYDLVRVPVSGSSHEVLVILVDPPEWGQGPFICRKSGDGQLRDGAVFVRADGETREARADELQQLIQRGQVATTPPTDFAVRVVGTVRPIMIDSNRTIEEFVTLHRGRLRAALQQENSYSHTDAQSDTPGIAAMIRSTNFAALAFSEPESRSEDTYLRSIDEWEQAVRAAWPTAVRRLIGNIAHPVEIQIANLEKTFFHDVELKVHLHGEVMGTEHWSAHDELDLGDLGIPTPPRAWGPAPKLGHHSLNVSGIVPAWQRSLTDSYYVTRTTWEGSGPITWEFSVGQLRPLEVDTSDDKALVLYTPISGLKSIRGTWQVTARDHHDVYMGSLEVEVGETLNLTNVFRHILGLNAARE